MASANIPAAASDIQQGILAKLGAQDGFYNAVCPVWEGLRLIRDEVTQAASGLVQVTAVALHNFKVVRLRTDEGEARVVRGRNDPDLRGH